MGRKTYHCLLVIWPQPSGGELQAQKVCQSTNKNEWLP